MKNLLNSDHVVITEHDVNDFGIKQYDAKVVFETSISIEKGLQSSVSDTGLTELKALIKNDLHSQLEHIIYEKTFKQNRKVKSMVYMLEHLMATVNLSNACMSNQDYDNIDHLLEYINDIKKDFL